MTSSRDIFNLKLTISAGIFRTQTRCSSNATDNPPTGCGISTVHMTGEQNTMEFKKTMTFLSTADVARSLGVAARTLCLWAECGEIPAIEIGRQ